MGAPSAQRELARAYIRCKSVLLGHFSNDGFREGFASINEVAFAGDQNYVKSG